ncbi:MAG: dihydrodipicolinate reductase [Acidobacteriota bacterium]|nr:dihydrodipicolinate reductase [Acidobacteriota bacterium]
MKLALFGYGAMNRLVEARALGEGHAVIARFSSRDAGRSPQDFAEALRGADAAIDFSRADAVPTHTEACALAGVPLVQGTTGWHTQQDEVLHAVERLGGALIYGANFSIGVNLFYRIVARAAELIDSVPEYAPFIEEAHHSRKRDAPSGTALRLQEIVTTQSTRDVPVTSTRAGFIPGTHRVGFDSLADQIMLTHTARSREGFAAGALVAAKWIQGRRGVFKFTDLLDDVLRAHAILDVTQARSNGVE